MDEQRVRKLYEVIIGAYKTEEVPGTTNPDGSSNPATTTSTYQERVDSKNVVATDVADAISKVQLTEGQHIEAVNRLSVVDAV